MQALKTIVRGILGTSGSLLLYAVANYATLAIAARALDGQAFGLFAAYYALVSLLHVPASVLRISAVQAHTTGVAVPVAASLALVLGISGVATAAAAATTFAGDPGSLVNGVLVVLGTVLSATAWLGRGSLQAGERYGGYSLGLAAEAISRLVLLGVLVVVGGSPTMVLLVLLVSRLVGHLGMGARDVRTEGEPPRSWASWARREYAPMVASHALTVALVSLDVLIMTARFPVIAGDYGAITVAGKFVLFAGSTVSEAYIGVRHRAGRLAFALLIGVCLLACAPLLVVFSLVPVEAVAVVAGPLHLGLAHELPRYAWFAAANALVYVLFLEGMLVQRRIQTTAALAAAVAVQVVALGFVADSAAGFMALLPWTGAVAVLLVGLATSTSASRARSATRPVSERDLAPEVPARDAGATRTDVRRAPDKVSTERLDRSGPFSYSAGTSRAGDR